ncbi:MAG: hypothetical protein LBG11_01560 [Bifidobacteriaceae bacterium]|jgi:hypothetical protein|nr:hypothetical protein [Bifidobacteriaceae bacterium]
MTPPAKRPAKRLPTQSSPRLEKRIARRQDPHQEDGGRPFAWSAQYIDQSAPAIQGSWALKSKQAQRVFKLLDDLGGRTWSEVHQIVIDGHRAHHSEAASGLAVREVRDWFADAQIEEAFRLRVAATERIWGFVENQVFHIVWFDPDHRGHPVSKRGDKKTRH